MGDGIERNKRKGGAMGKGTNSLTTLIALAIMVLVGVILIRLIAESLS